MRNSWEYHRIRAEVVARLDKSVSKRRSKVKFKREERYERKKGKVSYKFFRGVVTWVLLSNKGIVKA